MFCVSVRMVIVGTIMLLVWMSIGRDAYSRHRHNISLFSCSFHCIILHFQAESSLYISFGSYFRFVTELETLACCSYACP